MSPSQKQESSRNPLEKMPPYNLFVGNSVVHCFLISDGCEGPSSPLGRWSWMVKESRLGNSRRASQLSVFLYGRCINFYPEFPLRLPSVLDCHLRVVRAKVFPPQVALGDSVHHSNRKQRKTEISLRSGGFG